MNKKKAVQLLIDGKLKEGFLGLNDAVAFDYTGSSDSHFTRRKKGERVLIVNIRQPGWGEQLMHASMIKDFIEDHKLNSEDIFWLGNADIHSLIKETFGITTTNNVVDIPSPFFWVKVTEIASQCRQDINDFLDHKDPYITVDVSEEVQKLRKEKKRLVGLNWASYTDDAGKANRQKSIPVTSFKALTSISDIQWVSVQYKPENHESEYDGDIRFFEDLFDDNFSCPMLPTSGDQKPLAEYLKGLDALISCSNSTAHLAGAIGVPTYLIFPDRGTKQWHWHLRDDERNSLWYRKTKVCLMRKLHTELHFDLAMNDAIHWLQQIKSNS